MNDGRAGTEFKRMLFLSFFIHLSLISSSLLFLLYNQGKPLRPLSAYQVRLVTLPQEEIIIKPAPPVPVVPEERKEAEKEKVKVEPNPKEVKEKKAPVIVEKTRKEIAVVSKPKKAEAPPPADIPKESDKSETAITAKVAPAEPMAPEVPSIGDVSPVSPSPSAPVGTATVDVPDFKYSYYLLAIQNKVSANWFPPPGIEYSGVKEVMVVFKIRRNGDLMDVTIEKGSGNDYFDQAALRAVLRSKPLPPLPQGFFDDSLNVHFTFIIGKKDG